MSKDQGRDTDSLIFRNICNLSPSIFQMYITMLLIHFSCYLVNKGDFSHPVPTRFPPPLCMFLWILCFNQILWWNNVLGWVKVWSHGGFQKKIEDRMNLNYARLKRISRSRCIQSVHLISGWGKCFSNWGSSVQVSIKQKLTVSL